MSLLEAEILTRAIAPQEALLDRKAAEAILQMGFKDVDKQRVNELAEKARLGTLSQKEKDEADSYERVGHLISLLKSKARRSLAFS